MYALLSHLYSHPVANDEADQQIICIIYSFFISELRLSFQRTSNCTSVVKQLYFSIIVLLIEKIFFSLFSLTLFKEGDEKNVSVCVCADFKYLNPRVKLRFCSHSWLQGYCLLWLWLYNVIITYDYNINYLNTTNINAQII